MPSPIPTEGREVADVIAKLTPDMKRELLTLGERPEFKSIWWSVCYGYRFESMGIAGRALFTDRTVLTKFGKLVRQQLLREQGE